MSTSHDALHAEQYEQIQQMELQDAAVVEMQDAAIAEQMQHMEMQELQQVTATAVDGVYPSAVIPVAEASGGAYSEAGGVTGMLSPELLEVLSLGKATRWLAMIDGAFALMNVVYLGVFGLLGLMLPVLGYYGAKNFKTSQVLWYLVYRALNLLVRVIYFASTSTPLTTSVANLFFLWIEVFL